MKRWIVAFLVGALVVTGGLAFAQAGADQYRAAGDKCFAAKDYANAYKYYAYAAKMNPNDAAALKGVGNCLYMYQRKDQALQYYEKSLALNPGDTQLANFVRNLKAQAGTAPAVGSTGSPQASGSLAQGKALVQQKQYAAAIPVLQQAVRENPNDYQGYYYLGYAQYGAGDRKNAAVNFGLANAKQPNAQLKAYADKVKASLPPADQQWVDAQIASGGVAVAGTGAAGAAVKPKVFGIRLSPAIALFKLKDLEDEGAAIEAALNEANSDGTTPEFLQGMYFGSPGQYGMTGDVPSGNLYFGIGPVIRPAQGLEIGLEVGLFSVGKYSVDITSPNLDDVTLTDSIRKAYDVSTMPIGLSVGYAFGKGKVSPKVGLGADYYSVTIKETMSVIAGTTGYGYTGEYKSSGIGMHVDLGLDFKFGTSVVAGPYFRYRMAKFTDFTGDQQSGGESTSGKLMVHEESHLVVFNEDGDPETGLRPLDIDLGGLQVGLNVAAFF